MLRNYCFVSIFALIAFALLPGIFLSGCTEEQNAEAKELWLGIPNKTPPPAPLLTIEEDDSPEIRRYKELALVARKEQYEQLPSKRALKMFAEKADSVDLNNIRDLMYSRATPNRVDTRFRERPELYMPPPERRYSRLDFENSYYGDMHRAGGAMQDLGASMMQQGAINAEREAIAKATSALNSYVVRMEKTKLNLLRNHSV